MWTTSELSEVALPGFRVLLLLVAPVTLADLVAHRHLGGLQPVAERWCGSVRSQLPTLGFGTFKVRFMF